MKILVCSDFHGNYLHAQKCTEAVAMYAPDVFVYLGDLCPLRTKFPTAATASAYVEQRIFGYFAALDVPYKFVMCGNTDFKPCIEKWKKQYYSQADGFIFVQDGRFYVFGRNLIFLSTTEASPHALKDCEALGTSGEPYTAEYVFSGPGCGSFRTANGLVYSEEFVRYERLDDVPEQLAAEFKRTILSRLEYLWDPEKRNLLFSHAPPFGCCDLTPKRHAGSKDVRKFIETHDVEACFAGHIHSGVALAQSYKSCIAQCTVMCPGGSGIDTEYLNEVNFVLYDTKTREGQRFSIAAEDFEFCFQRYY